MNGYLVVGRGEHDDFPIGLFETQREADAAAVDVPLDLPSWQTAVMLNDATIRLLSVGIVEFKNGMPSKINTIVKF